VQVARSVPGRTPKQCCEHYLYAKSLPARDVAHLWTLELKRELFELRARHCPGSRRVNWGVIASTLSQQCGTRLTTEDVRKQSRALVKRLAAHGMPPGYSVTQQLEYLTRYPEAFHTRMDKYRDRLHAWSAANGVNIRTAGSPADTAPPAKGASREQGLEAASAGENVSGLAAACARANRMRELLQQSHYLKMEDDAEPAASEDTLIEEPEGACVESARDHQSTQASAAQVLQRASADKHPVAAALRSFLLRSDSHATSVAKAASVQTAEEPEVATPADVPAVSAEETCSPQPQHEAVSTVGGCFDPRSSTPHENTPFAPQTPANFEEYSPHVPVQAAKAPQCEQLVARQHSSDAISIDPAGFTANVRCTTPDASTCCGERMQGDFEGVSWPILHGSIVPGQLGEGRWIQYVKVNPAQRRARIAALKSANRLRVFLLLRKLREEQGIMQEGEGGDGDAEVAGFSNTLKAKISDVVAPPGSKRKRAVCEQGNAVDEREGTLPANKRKRVSTTRKTRKGSNAEQGCPK
jgi:hypothetical protein